jgi:hypothetical protein
MNSKNKNTRDQFVFLSMEIIIRRLCLLSMLHPLYSEDGSTLLTQSKVILLTDGQSDSLSCYQATIWDPQLLFLSLPSKIYLQFYSCGVPSLRCGWVRNSSVQLLLGLASAVPS